MNHSLTTDEQAVRDLVTSWAAAVRAKDLGRVSSRITHGKRLEGAESHQRGGVPRGRESRWRRNRQPPNLLGPYAQGRPSERFVYVHSGTPAGQVESPVATRQESLQGITWTLVDQVQGPSSHVLEARVAGTGGDGGPVYASVRLVSGDWRVVPPAVRGVAAIAGDGLVDLFS